VTLLEALARFVWSVLVAPQECHDFLVTMLAREIARPLPLRVAGIGIGAVLQKQAHKIQVSPIRRLVKRHVVALLEHVRRRPRLQKALGEVERRLRVQLRDRAVQWSDLRRVSRGCFQIGARVEQYPKDLPPPEEARKNAPTVAQGTFYKRGDVVSRGQARKR